MWGLVWAKSEYSRLVSASLNIPDSSYCVQRDSEGERATDKGKCTRFSENSCFLTLDCPSFDSFILCNKIHEGLSRYFYVCWLAGPSSRGLSLLQRLCLISIFMVSGGGRQESDMCSQKAKVSPHWCTIWILVSGQQLLWQMWRKPKKHWYVWSSRNRLTYHFKWFSANLFVAIVLWAFIRFGILSVAHPLCVGLWKLQSSVLMSFDHPSKQIHHHHHHCKS